MHIFTEYVAKYLSLKMLIFGLSWLEHSPSIMSIIFIKKKNATALQQRCCFFPFNTSMMETLSQEGEEAATLMKLLDINIIKRRKELALFLGGFILVCSC